MCKNLWNKTKLYWLTEGKCSDLPLPLPLWPVNEKKSMPYSKFKVNSKVTLEFRNENVWF